MRGCDRRFRAVQCQICRPPTWPAPTGQWPIRCCPTPNRSPTPFTWSACRQRAARRRPPPNPERGARALGPQGGSAVAHPAAAGHGRRTARDTANQRRQVLLVADGPRGHIPCPSRSAAGWVRVSVEGAQEPVPPVHAPTTYGTVVRPQGEPGRCSFPHDGVIPVGTVIEIRW